MKYEFLKKNQENYNSLVNEFKKDGETLIPIEGRWRDDFKF